MSHAQSTTTEDVDNCDKICPMIYEPICADNGNGEKKTFGSKCALDSVSCQERAGKNINLN